MADYKAFFCVLLKKFKTVEALEDLLINLLGLCQVYKRIQKKRKERESQYIEEFVQESEFLP